MNLRRQVESIIIATIVWTLCFTGAKCEPSENNSTTNSTTPPSDHVDHEDLVKYRQQYESIAKPDDPYCQCDLVANQCQVNCCCDTDCTAMQKYSFAQCNSINEDEEVQQGEQRCTTKRTATNRQQGTMNLGTHLNWMCIARDNTRSTMDFPNRKSIEDLDELLSIRARHSFHWTTGHSANAMGTQFATIKNTTRLIQDWAEAMEYKSGRPVIVAKWSTNNRTTATLSAATGQQPSYYHWKLPFSYHFKDGECNKLRHVGYMHDNGHWSCLTSVPPDLDLASVCTQNAYWNVSNYYKNVHFLYKASLNDVHSYRLVPVQVDGDVGQLAMDRERCVHVVSSVHYTIWHRGLYGITRVQLTVHQINVSRADKHVRQHFAVLFKWDTQSTSDNSSKVQPPPSSVVNDQRARLRHYTKFDAVTFALATGNNSFSVLPPDSTSLLVANYKHGVCRPQNHQSLNRIHFAQNQLSTCVLPLNLKGNGSTAICRAIKSEIGNHIASINNLSHLHVAALSGHHSSADVSHSPLVWLPLLLVNDRTSNGNRSGKSASGRVWTQPSINKDDECHNIVNSVTYQVFYVRHGRWPSVDHHHHSARYKIVGASAQAKTLPVHQLKVKCWPPDSWCTVQQDLDLTVTINYVDISEPLRPHYAPPPSIKFELPEDFFYPFFLASSSTSSRPLIVGCSGPLIMAIVTASYLINK